MLDGVELIAIAVVVVAFLFWGPGQLPKLARSLGEAKREFTKALNANPSSTNEKKRVD